MTYGGEAVFQMYTIKFSGRVCRHTALTMDYYAKFVCIG